MHARRQLFHALPRTVCAMMPEVRVTRARLFALFAVGLLLAGRVQLLAIARELTPGAKVLSSERRLRRFLANRAVRVNELWTPILQATLPRLARPSILLVFDPTPCGPGATLLLLGLVIHRRVLPLQWRLVPQQARWPERMADYLTPMAATVAPLLPQSSEVTVLLDRGLIGPAVIDAFRAVGWQIVLRLRASANDATTARLDDGTEQRVVTLITKPGQRLSRPITLFKGRRQRTGWLTIHWARGEPAPLILFSDRPGGSARVRDYRRRVHCEATYADWKCRGFQLSATRVRALDRLDRLVAVLALVTWWLHGLGQAVIKQGLRHRYDRPDRRDVSLIKLGRFHLLACLQTDHPAPIPFTIASSGAQFRWRL